jgi:tyrosine ammonia-lyase
VPTNANNQDIVSMGTIAARKTADLLNDCFKILAIEAMALTQAAELRAGGPPEPGPDRPLASWCAWVRAHSPALTTDRPLSGEIGQLADRLQETSATRPWVS